MKKSKIIVLGTISLLCFSGAVIADSKLCSGVTPGAFRTAINVPDTWTAQDCQKWVLGKNYPGSGAPSHGQIADQFQIGCVTANGVNYAAAQGTVAPVPNSCGWEPY